MDTVSLPTRLWQFITQRKIYKYRKLKKHQFFLLMHYWINVEIDNLPITNELKKRVVIKFLKIKFSIFEKNFLNFIANINTTDDPDLEKIFLDSIMECEETAIHKYIPELFIEKFRQWHSSHISITFEAIRSINESTFYDSSYEKVAATLDILLFTFRLTIVDAEKTINELNGELEKVLKGTIFDY